MTQSPGSGDSGSTVICRSESKPAFAACPGAMAHRSRQRHRLVVDADTLERRVFVGVVHHRDEQRSRVAGSHHHGVADPHVVVVERGILGDVDVAPIGRVVRLTGLCGCPA